MSALAHSSVPTSGLMCDRFLTVVLPASVSTRYEPPCGLSLITSPSSVHLLVLGSCSTTLWPGCSLSWSRVVLSKYSACSSAVFFLAASALDWSITSW